MAHATNQRRRKGDGGQKHSRVNARAAIRRDSADSRRRNSATASNRSRPRDTTPSKKTKLNWHDIDGWFTDADAECYQRIVERVPPNGTIVEIGAWMGRSTGALIEQCRKQ